MGLESGTYLNDLNTANPTATDPKSQGDDHIRLIKTCAKDTFPGFAGIVIGTATESGSSNAYALTLSPAPASYTPLLNAVLLFKATHANTGAATLNVNALGTKPIVDVNGGALASGDIANASMVAVFYDGTSFCLISANDRSPIDSPTFTGTPAAPTPSAADNSTKIATTAYVDTADALKANLASPTFTGTPAAPTAAGGTNTTQLATTAFVQQQAFATALPVQTGAAGKVLTSDGANASWSVPPTAPDVIIQCQRTSGTGGAGLTAGAYTTRVLNTVVRNNGSVASLATNAITLPAGAYYARAVAMVLGGSGGGAGVGTKARLYNNTDSAAIAVGLSTFAAVDATDSFQVPGMPLVSAYFTLAGSKAIILQTYATATIATPTEGAAVSAGDVEIYATVEIWKVL